MHNNAGNTILLCSLLLTGCLQTDSLVQGDEPDWLYDEPANYPHAKYVSATGSASDAETAQKRAQANLAKVFELRVRETAIATQDVQSHTVAEVETVSSAQRINSRIDVSTDKIIEGARIAGQWRNSDDLTYYALAVLDRHQTGYVIREEIDRLDDATLSKLRQADGESDGLLRVAAIHSAIVLQQQRKNLQKTLRVIDLSGRGTESRWAQTELSHRLQQALSALQIRPVVVDDSLGGLEQRLHAAMAQAGFGVAGSDAAYRLVLDVVTEPSFQQQRWYWQRASMVLRLEAPDGIVRGQTSWSLKVSASRPEVLKSRLLTSIENKLNTQLGAAVLNFASLE